MIQHRNVLSLSWRLSEYAWMTHCFFEQQRFDAVRLEGHWAFAQVGNAYVGIYSQHGMVVGDAGQYAGRELICGARENTWLVECGRAADWGSFDAFVSAVQAAPIEAHDGVISYEFPSIGRFVTGWDVAPTAGGERIEFGATRWSRAPGHSRRSARGADDPLRRRGLPALVQSMTGAELTSPQRHSGRKVTPA